jgi:hypothetical protein
MDIRLGGGRTVTITLGDRDRMNVEGVMYPTGTSITFYEDQGSRCGDEVTIFFPNRDRMRQLAHRIVEEIDAQ